MSRNPRIAVFTSGGDSQGMNAAVRAVVRAGVNAGLEVFAIYEGYEGMIRGGDYIKPMQRSDVGGILHLGGTVIGSARSAAFRTREGRLEAAFNLVSRGIDALVVIGGDGSLTGANLFRQEWQSLLVELQTQGRLTEDIVARHPHLSIVGLVGSIDNDMFGTDMTIGADTALHRIVEAVDAIASTAASHQRSFVVEVMGRHCGYLALMAGLATGANWILIPESPAEAGWEDEMCETIGAGRDTGRRHNIVMVAEGAIDCEGKPISSEYVQRLLSERLGEDTRVTILGHVQRGGSPSAFDRNMSTLLGYAAVQELISAPPEQEPQLVGLRQNNVVSSPLMENVQRTHGVAELIKAGRYQEAMAARGRGFVESFEILQTLLQAHPREPQPGQRKLRLAVMHAGGPAPGMNTAVRAAIRLGIDSGHTMLGIQNGLPGLLHNDIQEMGWMDVHGWVAKGGAELGTSRRRSTPQDAPIIAQRVSEHQIDGLLIIGGWAGYQLAYDMYRWQFDSPALALPVVCVPATINNDLPGTDLTIGADTALNSIVMDVDKIKESAVASRRCYVVEVMGHDCGYLALMGGMATGAERIYLPEDGITLEALRTDVNRLIDGFEHGKRLGLMIRSENADRAYTTDFIVTLFEKEGGNLFDVRRCILGHTQQGGKASPFDRIQATRLTARALEFLIEHASTGQVSPVAIGRVDGEIRFASIAKFPDLIDPNAHRPKVQRWLSMRVVADTMARSTTSELTE